MPASASRSAAAEAPAGAVEAHHPEAGRKLLSIVIPVFNEEENVRALYEALQPVLESLQFGYDFELLFTDNCSTDRTYEIIAELANEDQRIRALRFSRNFGFQRSVLTGFLNARGDAAVQIDCDLQDPPGLIADFVRHWESGYQVVYGIRRQRRERWWLHNLRRAFYRLIDMLSETDLPVDAGDFRLVDRRVLDELGKLEDDQPYVRGAIAALGFRQVGIPYDRDERRFGTTHFSFSDLCGLAVDGILNHSIIPLRIATFTGLAISLLTVIAAVCFAIGKLVLGQDWPAGFATIVIIVLLSVGINAIFLGVMGEYLGRVYKQVKKRPLTIVADSIDHAAERD
ncbi:MAG: glycosyltransferase family 2 protein [Gammaproteobacteria bacterium]|nr:glycosyltransferase family 2 protein [Gammaproteobacteria bacterium]NNM00283.1 glycosyltransferase family 2 protein [Gammaproteobacteria bacterium]